jgi:ketosteroid isomerase-like protein
MAIPKTDPHGVPVRRDVRSEVQRFLDHLARALTAGDGEAVAAMYDVPALIISDEGVIAVNSTAQIAKFFGDAHAQYNANGVVDTRADLQDLERIGERILVATVRWPHLDASQHEVASESSDYTLRRDDEGRLRIRSVLMRGTAARPR